MHSLENEDTRQQAGFIHRSIQGGAPCIELTGLSGSAASLFVSEILDLAERPCLVILPDPQTAERFHKELTFFLSEPERTVSHPSPRLHQFPPYDLTPLTGLSPHREVVTRRLLSLYALLSDNRSIVTTSPEAIFYRTLPKESLVRSLEYLEPDEDLAREPFLEDLMAKGYQRVSLVEEVGDFAVRGGVIDLFAPLYPLPLRLEFWGDRLESIRYFDPVSQRSQDRLPEVVLLPASEVLMKEENLRRARSMGRLPGRTNGGQGFPGQEAWLNHFYESLDSPLGYLPEKGLLILFEPHRMPQSHQRSRDKFAQDVRRFRAEASEKATPFPEVDGLLSPLEEVEQEIHRHQRIEATELDLEPGSGQRVAFRGPFQLDGDLEVRLAEKGRVSLAPLAERLSRWRESHARVVLVSRTEQQAERIREILENYQVRVDRTVTEWSRVPAGPGLTICLGRLPKGFVWPRRNLYVISEDEIFGPKTGRTRARGKDLGRPLEWSSLSQLHPGDLVVHEEHGIGRYDGLFTMEVDQQVNDFVLIEYSQGDKLYIPADRISVLQKYVGVDGAAPKLDRLGGRSWDIAKQRAQKSVRTIAKQLLEIYALRKYRKGYAFSQPDQYFREFEAAFQYEETPDQIRAIDQVLDDMVSERPMDRLICGDVGFGKTEVALRAAFKAVSDGKQAAMLVPTTVLAEQHYETFRKRMTPYGITVGVLSRFKTPAQQNHILARLRSGKLQILIGTHRMLQKDVKFQDLGLLIIDEEQRFGVKQKEALKKYRSLVDVLAITATPIPRTLHMSLMGIRDLSIIETPPEERLAIQSYLSPYDDALVARAIRFERERGGQVFFVHNKVQTIDQMADRLKRLVPEARFAVAHGQMKERELEETMLCFLRKEIDVLVCTTIIESGLDIPSANTIIIHEVDRMGLAQVYQLRGRVGRSTDKAYAYLLLSENTDLTREAEKRLKALMDFSHLGAGLHLAMHDLKIRGGGNILGFVQSGQISAIGYELYLKLMERAIAELRGEEWQEEINPEISVDMPAFLPSEYISDTDVRLNLYRRLSGLREKRDLEAITEEIHDRFGPPPDEAKNLLGLMSVRLLLQQIGAGRLEVGRNGLVLTFQDPERVHLETLLQAIDDSPRRYQFLSPNKLKVQTGPLSPPADLEKIQEAIESLHLPRNRGASDGGPEARAN